MSSRPTGARSARPGSRSAPSATGSTSTFPVFERALRTFEDLRRAGAASLDLAWTAAGVLDGYFEQQLGTWDVAAGGRDRARSRAVSSPTGRATIARGSRPATSSPARPRSTRASSSSSPAMARRVRTCDQVDRGGAAAVVGRRRCATSSPERAVHRVGDLEHCVARRRRTRRARWRRSPSRARTRDRRARATTPCRRARTRGDRCRR